MQGVESQAGTASVTVSAPGFAPAQHDVTVAPPGVEIWTIPATIDLVAPGDTSFSAQVGLPCPGSVSLCETQSVRAGSPGFVVTASSSAPAVAMLRSDGPVAAGTSVTKPILPGLHYTAPLAGSIGWGLSIDALTPGSTVVSVSGPPGVTTMSGNGVRTVTVTNSANPPE